MCTDWVAQRQLLGVYTYAPDKASRLTIWFEQTIKRGAAPCIAVLMYPARRMCSVINQLAMRSSHMCSQSSQNTVQDLRQQFRKAYPQSVSGGMQLHPLLMMELNAPSGQAGPTHFIDPYLATDF